MPIEISPLDTNTLLGFYREVPAPSNYFRNLLVSSVINSEDEFIDFEKLVEGRKLAPLVVPTAQGVPMYSEASRMSRVKPAYLKPKDPVSPGRAIKRRPGEGMFSPNSMSPRGRFMAIIGDILRTHRSAIERRLEWMCAEAAIHGKVTLAGENYPTTVVDFGRNADHTVVLTGLATWGNEDADIVGDLNTWIERVRRAEFGGPVNRVTLGKDVVGPFLKNKSVREHLDTQIRGTNGELNIGIRTGEYSERLGRLGNLEIWTTSDFYELPQGGTKEFMPAKGVLLTGPNINMVEAYGAILDDKANFNALPVFPKQWTNDDPAVTFVMTQSSPIEVPVNPNNTLFATVLA